MAIFKCKMCGGTLEINNNETVATCEYCGTGQTLPKLDDEKRANMYDRANHFRRNNEFDKAMGIYEQILNEDKTDAEAYWSLVLCRYGIEYVEDPASHKRVPTVNRAQFTSVFDDDNYKSALQYADVYQKAVYEEEAKTINEIQKGILAISQKEEPFDVFICYKETDNNGRRTQDSVLANDLYHQLTQEGFKVFFARITLEDKLGSAYEPYIFAALNSAKVMVVIGTKPEFFKAVWVRNEWSRYLALIKQGQQKMLIPAYRDMDPYDLPEEFSHLQAQDMSKLGFMQDLIRGIKKIVHTDEPKQTVVKETVVTNVNSNTDPLLKRAFMFLEDGDWSSANEYCEKVLDIDPENSQAYIGKLMVDLKVRKQEGLCNCKEPFDTNGNYQKALRFADENTKELLMYYINSIRVRKENERLEEIYNRAKMAFVNAKYYKACIDAAHNFETIINYKDSSQLAKNCYEKAEVIRKDAILVNANEKMARGKISAYEEAIDMLKTIPGWRDSNDMISFCMERIDEINAEEKARQIRREKRRRKIKNTFIGLVLTGVIATIAYFITILIIIPNVEYNKALKLMKAGKYTEAIAAFEAMDGYKDSDGKIDECKYNDAVELMETGKYEEAIEKFSQMEGYKDSEAKITECVKGRVKNAKIGDVIEFGKVVGKNNEWQVLDRKDNKILVISKDVVCALPYNDTMKSVTWETCTLRNWLNTSFMNMAFSENEKLMIPTVTVHAHNNPEYDVDSGNSVQDKVFLLSVEEANRYFKNDGERRVESNKRWWLRTSGMSDRWTAVVEYDGGIDSEGYSVNKTIIYVRPAMWIDINE